MTRCTSPTLDIALAERQETPDEALEIVPSDILSPIVFSEVFWNDRLVEVDLGSGPGKFLVEAAQNIPIETFSVLSACLAG